MKFIDYSISACFGAALALAISAYLYTDRLAALEADLAARPRVVVADSLALAAKLPEGATTERIEAEHMRFLQQVQKYAEAGYLIIQGGSIVHAPEHSFVLME